LAALLLNVADSTHRLLMYRRLWLSIMYRLDQTLGKPGAWMVTTDNEKQRLTVVVRLSRLESQASEPTVLRHFNDTCAASIGYPQTVITFFFK